MSGIDGLLSAVGVCKPREEYVPWHRDVWDSMHLHSAVKCLEKKTRNIFINCVNLTKERNGLVVLIIPSAILWYHW